jgi:Zn-dependent protease with chaperone function
MKDISIQLEHKKAKRSFRIITLTGLLFISLISCWFFLGMPKILNSTQIVYQVSTCTGNICSKCLFTLPVLKVFLTWLGLSILCAGLIKALYKSCIMVSKDRMLRNGLLPVSVKKISSLDKLICQMKLPDNIFLPFKNDRLKYAFTSGILRPKIFLSTGACNYLTPKELKLVILHELYHYREKGPLKNYVIFIIQELLFFVPFIHLIVRVFSDANEKAADDHAVEISRDPLELASTLIKMGKASYPENPVLVSPITGFQNLEKRIKRLAGLTYPSSLSASPTRQAGKTKEKKLFVFGGFILLVLFVLLFLPVVFGKSAYFMGQRLNICYQMSLRGIEHTCYGEQCNKSLKDNDYLDCCKI